MTTLQFLAAAFVCLAVGSSLAYALELLTGDHGDDPAAPVDYRERMLANGDGQ